MLKPPNWTEAEKEILRRYFPTESKEYLSSILHRNFAAIERKANYLGIRRYHPESRFDSFWTPEPNTGCRLWTGSVNRKGYGQISNQRPVLAHRVSWELYIGPIPNGLCVLHKCDIPSCVNHRHLFLGTQQDNSDDCCKKKRQLFGEQKPGAKLSDAAVIAIRQDSRTQREIAKSFGVSQSAIAQSKIGKTWKHVTNPS
jgi:hypothetical protein